MRYEARMEGASQAIGAGSFESAIEEAKQWAREGDWDTSGGTVWVHAYLLELDDDGEEVESHGITVTIDPPEPECVAGEEHDWQAPYALLGGLKENPGVWGHGGGVVIHEVCMRCGCEKVTDTWAQDPETGRQGLDSVRYEERKHDVAYQVDQAMCGGEFQGDIDRVAEYLTDHGRPAVAVHSSVNGARNIEETGPAEELWLAALQYGEEE